MLINNFLKYLQYEKKYSTHTVFAYKRDIEQFFDFISGESSAKPQVIENSDIRLWISSLMEAGQSPKTIHRKLSSLKSFYKYLQLQNIVSVNPAALIKAPKLSKRLPVFLKEKEMDALFSLYEFNNDFEGVRDKCIFELFYGTGLRLSELVGLRHGDLDFDKEVIKVLGKRNKERLMPINTSVTKSLWNYIEFKKEKGFNFNGALFVTKEGKEIYSKLVYRLVNKHLGHITSLHKKSPHVLRHTFATIMLNKGADINAVKSLMGHANLSATEVYTHNTFEELKKVYKDAHPRA